MIGTYSYPSNQQMYDVNMIGGRGEIDCSRRCGLLYVRITGKSSGGVAMKSIDSGASRSFILAGYGKLLRRVWFT
jgi:hypothetical protein